jgi:hypothetical protein
MITKFESYDKTGLNDNPFVSPAFKKYKIGDYVLFKCSWRELKDQFIPGKIEQIKTGMFDHYYVVKMEEDIIREHDVVYEENIKRLLTPEEIENFDMKISIKKYNL